MNQMTENNEVEDVEYKEITIPAALTPMQKWKQEKLVNRAKKKAKKQLVAKGFSLKEAGSMVKKSVNRIASKAPERRGSNRGG